MFNVLSRLKSKIIIIAIICFIGIIFIITTNYECFQRMNVAYNFQKDNGISLVYSIAYTFDAWDDNIDTSDGYYITKKYIDKLGDVNNDEGKSKIKEVSKNNVKLSDEQKKNKNNNTISIKQCMFLKDIKVLYITYNTYFTNNNKLIRLSLHDDLGNTIANEPSWVNTSNGLMIRNSENLFWGIDFDKYENIVLNVQVYSNENKPLYEYKHRLYN